MSDQPLVSAEEMQSVLSGDDHAEDANREAGPPSDRYSLRRPLVIPAQFEKAATRRLTRLAKQLAEVMGSVLSAEIEIDVHGFQQQQVRAAVDRLAGPPWVLFFTRPEGGGMALGLDPPSGLALVELSMGGAGTLTAKGRAPTPLENRVMENLASALRQRLSRLPGLAIEGCGFRIGAVGRDFGPPGEMVGAGLLRIRIGGAERSGLLLATADLLTEKESDDSAASAGAESPLAERLMEARLRARPVLRGGGVAYADLLMLEPGKLLRLDVTPDEPLWLTVGDVPVMRGRIERRDGKAVLRIVEAKRNGTDIDVVGSPQGRNPAVEGGGQRSE